MGFGHKFLRFFSRPSRLIGSALGVGAILMLVGKPLSNGDGIAARLQTAMNPANNNPLAVDSAGNNLFSIAAIQMQANLGDALGMAIPAAIVLALGKAFKF